MTFQFDEQEDVAIEEIVSNGSVSQLIVHNDDYNTFDWVIQCFLEVLGYEFIQAEQLSYIIHFKGKAIVKTDTFDTLKPLKDALIDRGLSAVIEREKKYS